MTQWVHYSKEPLCLIEDIEQNAEPDHKPRGLWISDQTCEDNWRNWCEDNNFGLSRLKYVHLIQLSEDFDILHLKDIDDIDSFHDEYAVQLTPSYLPAAINWKLVASKYDGILITPYIWQRRSDGHASSWYYGWDCASGCIWKNRAISSFSVVEN